MTRFRLLGFLLMAARLDAGLSDLGGGGVGMAWMNLAAQARVGGLAGAGAGWSQGLGALEGNPAGLAGMKHPSVGVSYRRLIEDGALSSISAGMPLQDFNLAFKADSMNWGAVELTTGQGPTGYAATLGAFSPWGFAGTLALATSLGSLSGGISFKAVGEDLGGGSSWGLLSDLGMQWLEGQEGLGAGLSLNKIGSSASGGMTPSEGRVGLSYTTLRPGRPVALMVDWVQALNDAPGSRLALAGEADLHPMLSVRAGYSASASPSAPSGASAGLTLRLEPLSLHYAFDGSGELGGTHFFSLEASFPGKTQAPAAGPKPRAAAPAAKVDLLQAAEEAMAKDNFGVAVENMERLKKEDPLRARNELPRLRETMMRRAMKDDDLNRAERALKLMLDIDPGYEPGWEALARIYWHLGRDFERQVAAQKALELDPSRSEAMAPLLEDKKP